MASTLLQALLKNESGGRNVTNVHQSTSSGRARGYFQITDGTWKEFGGDKYAPTALEASYDQQADIASKIPLKRWDKSTIAMMNATGRPINVNATLGENLAMNKESFANATGLYGGGGGQYNLKPRHVGGAGSKPGYFNTPKAGYEQPTTTTVAGGDTITPPIGGGDKPKTWNEALGGGLKEAAKGMTWDPIQLAPQQAVGFDSASPVPSVYRPQLMPTQVQAGVGGMGGGQDMRQLLAMLMQGRA